MNEHPTLPRDRDLKGHSKNRLCCKRPPRYPRSKLSIAVRNRGEPLGLIELRETTSVRVRCQSQGELRHSCGAKVLPEKPLLC